MRALLSWQQIDAQHGWHAEIASDADGVPVTLLLGPEQAAPAPFSAAIPSWIAETPPGSWIEVQLRARIAGHWTGFYRIARWDDQAAGGARQSFSAQRDADGQVNTDTLSLAGAADAIQPRVLLHAAGGAQPALRALRIALSAPSELAQRSAAFAPCELPVPPRSQMAYPHGARICSPTSVAMLLAYWYARTGDCAFGRLRRSRRSIAAGGAARVRPSLRWLWQLGLQYRLCRCAGPGCLRGLLRQPGAA